MSKFVAWSIEREHGDLGLRSSADPKPPLSKLGMMLDENRTGGAVQDIVQQIANKAYGNVAIAKLRLELVHGSQTLSPIKATLDRLPRNLVDVFDAGVSTIDTLGLLAIATVAQNPSGVLIEKLERSLLDASGMSPSLEEILRAAKGFLVMLPTKPIKVMVYHSDFGFYIRENYNESMFETRSKLLADR